MFLAFDTIVLHGKVLASCLLCCFFVGILVFLLSLLFRWGRDRKRLWLHQQIAHMRCWFIVFACAIVIVVPAVLLRFADIAIHQPDDVLIEQVENTPKERRTDVINAEEDKCANPLTNAFFSAIAGESPKADIDSSGVFYVLVSLFGYLVFSGFTVSMFVSMLQNKMQSISHGEELYSKLDNHYVIIGSGSSLIPLIEKLLDVRNTTNSLKERHWLARMREGTIELFETCIEKIQRHSQIVILTAESIPELRKRLSAHLPNWTLKRIVLVHGNRTNKEDLQQLCLPACAEIFLMGDSKEVDLDDRNIESLAYINKSLEMVDCKVKKCKIYLERYHTYSLFQGFIKETKLARLDVEPVCFYKHWAELVLGLRNSKNLTAYPKVDGKGIGVNSEKFVHLVVIGMSRMGMSLVTEAAMHLHFPNSDKKRTRITMIDLNARQEMYKFVNLNQNLFNEAYHTYREYRDTPFGGWPSKFSERNAKSAWLDTEFHFVQGNVESNDVRELLGSFAKEKDVCLTVAVCLPDARYALSVALSLPHELYNRDNVSILVQQEVGEGLLNLLGQQSKKAPNYSNVRPFGMLNEEIGAESDFDKLAPYVWTIYDPACDGKQTWESLEARISNPQLIKEMYTKWDSMQPWERISNRYAAMSSVYKKRSGLLGLEVSVDNVYKDEFAEDFGRMEHNRWCVERLLNGFRTLTPLEISSAEYVEKRNAWKKERFAHYGICKWEEICRKKEEIEFRGFYWNSINMGRAICLLPKIKELADEAYSPSSNKQK